MGYRLVDYLGKARTLRARLGRNKRISYSSTPLHPVNPNGNGHLKSPEIVHRVLEDRAAKKRELITGPAGVEELVASLAGLEEVAIDLETTGLSSVVDRVRLLSLSSGDKACLVDCFAVDPCPVLEILAGKLLYVHGAEFDIPFLSHQYGFEFPENVIDTLHLSQVVRAGEWFVKPHGGWQRVKHTPEEALLRELGVELGDKKKYQKGEAWLGELTDEHAEYAANDVLYLKPLAEKLLVLLRERKLEETWRLEQRAKPLFLEMCRRGVPFDKERWDRLVDELEATVVELKEHVNTLAPPHPDGRTWNWFSPKQAKEAFDLVGLSVPNLQRETLSRYKDPLIKAVSEYRNAKNELSRVRTWYEGHYKDGRIYSKWNPTGAVTGRASCASPNIQSLTKEGGYRSCIRP